MTMDMKRFEYLLDLHGADFTRWNEDDAQAAQMLLETAEAARVALKHAQVLDELMNAHRPGPLPDTTLARTMQALDRPGPVTHINDNRPAVAARLRYGGLALAACAALVMLMQFTGTQHGTVTGRPGGPATARQIALNEPSVADPALQEAEVELFVLAMADPLLDRVAEEALLNTLTAAAQADSSEIDLFVDEVLASEFETIGTVQ